MNDPEAHHGHGHGEQLEHDDARDEARRVVVEERILAKNDHLAGHNRAWLNGRGIFAVNLMSSPGSGKTTLLEHTIHGLDAGRAVAVIEGDQETVFDAERIRATGRPVLQINTGSGCHLDAAMVGGRCVA